MTDNSVPHAPMGRGVWAPELRGRTAIVTGAGRLRSIGRAIALELARQGVNIVLTGTGREPSRFPPDEQAIGWRDIESVAEEVRSIGANAMTSVLDITDQSSIAGLLNSATDMFGGIDILVNNAGAARGGDRAALVDLTLSDWDRVLNTNLTGTFLTTQAVARQMLHQKRSGSIINISSTVSRTAAAGAGVYSASKAGVNALSRTFAVELAEHGIRVNAILPGIVETSRLDDLDRDERWRQFIKATTPLGCAGNGTEIAYLCTYLCSDMGAWITGQDIAIDGGATWH